LSVADTIVALSTPTGQGALGVIRLSGPRALAIADFLFHAPSHPPLSQAPGYTCQYGQVEALDHVVATVFRAPRSYTGEDVVEFSAHGSPFVLQAIVQRCTQHGARLAGPGEFTLRAFLNGKMDLTQAEAVAELIQAHADKTHKAALSQLEGHLARTVRGLRDQLLPLLAHIEVGLDHSDESHEFLSRDQLMKGCSTARQAMDEVLSTAQTGKVLREGLRVAIVGRPNVGKSSLLNAFLQEERAIVTAIPGTTRDTLEEIVHWGGVPVVLVDTAGLRGETNDPVERLGMDRTRRAIEQSDFVIALVDASEAPTPEDRAVLALCASRPHVVVANKWDRVRDTVPVSENPWPGTLRLCAKTKEGLEDLVAHVRSHALSESTSATDARWLLNVRHRDALLRARDALTSALAAAQGRTFEECVALELKTALDALGEIIGETTTDDLLGQIFSKFCVGK